MDPVIAEDDVETTAQIPHKTHDAIIVQGW